MPRTNEQKQRRRELYSQNKERHNELRRIAYKKNPEKRDSHNKVYYDKNRERLLKYKTNWSNTPNGLKSHSIANWKYIGIIADDYDEWYEKYINCNECNFCGKEFKNTSNKHLDHNHTINDCENIRGVLCCKCNVRDVFLDLLI